MSSARADLELQVQKLQAEVAELRNRPQDSVEIDSRLTEQQELVDIQVGWLVGCGVSIPFLSGNYYVKAISSSFQFE